ncbi:uncharacterized protein LOC126838266 [Adelges cooleyi]|uniref:uncharacterized protein LOC126838266 n=1 Tax=Adelges cooleyi TaxID=133065 RepID=UPI00217F7593|nr:uncharacterized protein LOC126838266 [Adelges cooleyi]XP_050428519.1 uncharacterized protein LOC126838266 [Adelges cooleyi]XP_050428520.1 uncharacterized protein LOC126838266 [Adelges cooleyi]
MSVSSSKTSSPNESVPKPSLKAVMKYTFKTFSMANKVFCVFCNRVLDNKTQVLKKHFTVCTPLLFQPSPNTEYTCGPCSISTKSFKHWMYFHIGTKSHWEQCRAVNKPLYTYMCSSCEMMFYDTERSIRNHMLDIHEHKANLPYVCQFMAEVHCKSTTSGAKPGKPLLYLCGPCKEFGQEPIHPELTCTKVKKKSEPFYCKTCAANFICTEDVYLWHLSSVEHLVLLKETEISSNGWKVPRIVWSQFSSSTLNKHQVANCVKCKQDVPSTDVGLVDHFKKCTHHKPDMTGKNMSGVKLFCCGVCEFHMDNFNQWKNHVLSESHLSTANSVRNYSYYYCKLCFCLFYGTAKQVLDASKLLEHDDNTNHVILTFGLSDLMAFVYKTFNMDPFNNTVFFYMENTGKFGQCERSQKPDTVPHFCATCHIEFYSGPNVYNEHAVTGEHVLLKYFVLLKPIPPKPLEAIPPKVDEDDAYGQSVTLRLKAIKNDAAKKNLKIAIDTLFNLQLK